MKFSTVLVTVALGTLGCAAAGMSADVAKAHGHGTGVWKPAKPSDKRSPCPVLNTLANHGHLPRDGRGITPTILNDTLQDVLNLDPDLSGFMSAAVLQIADSQGKITLADLALHGFIEHDASLVHDDVLPGQTLAPTNVNRTKLAKLLTFANRRQTFTYLEFSRARAHSEILSRADGNVTLPGAFEPALILQAFGKGNGPDTELTLAASSVESIFGKERLPSDFKKRTNKPNAAAFFSFGQFIAGKVTEFKATATGV